MFFVFSFCPLLSSVVFFVTRGSQLAAELLVVGITWWYTYQSYRIRKGINLGKTISSLLLYNGELGREFSRCLADMICQCSGSMYFLCANSIDDVVVFLHMLISLFTDFSLHYTSSLPQHMYVPSLRITIISYALLQAALGYPSVSPELDGLIDPYACSVTVPVRSLVSTSFPDKLL